jgi:hypothetical protein
MPDMVRTSDIEGKIGALRFSVFGFREKEKF